MNRFLLFLAVILTSTGSISAGEGMWIPLFLQQMNEQEMQEMGMKISAEQIYSENHASLKDAIVIFGGGCTGELVSAEGLLLTNHHCGFGSIQKHSTLEHNYLQDGFWAMNRSEELPNSGLSVTFLVRMADVTEKALQGVKATMSEDERQKVIKKNIKAIVAEETEGTHYKAIVKPFFHGNQYLLFVNEIYTDVRLVGAPPSNIGKFGGDTDNWVWPRHTGDFSMFRIYADKDNNPAEYSVDNVPYKPKEFLEIALDGVDEGDFTFVFGYPGSTNEYASSYELDEVVYQMNPVRVDLRGKRLDIIGDAMESDPLTRIQYASKYAGIANSWKRMQGEILGFDRNSVIAEKQSAEQDFQQWANSTPELKAEYGGLLPAFETCYENMSEYDLSYYYLVEAVFGVEIYRYALGFTSLIKMSAIDTISDEDLQRVAQSKLRSVEGFFKNYVPAVDQQLCTEMLTAYSTGISPEFQPLELLMIKKKYKGDFAKYSEKLFAKSIFADQEALTDLLQNYKRSSAKKLENDMAFTFIDNAYNVYNQKVRPTISMLSDESDSLKRIYMKGLMAMHQDQDFYPDANFTMRVAYGKVDGFKPKDGITYDHFTTLKGIIEKENPDIYDYVVEDKLKELYNAKDYGRYADADGTMHVGFIATNHTTGGNSGSPVLDANGRLIGLNFDRAWEGTMSDMNYDAEICRNIALDIRYCLFLIDKFAGAGHLVDEMTIVE